MLEQVDVPQRGMQSMEVPHRTRFSGRSCDPAGDLHRSSRLLKDYTPWRGPMLEQFLKNCSLWEKADKCLKGYI